MQLFCFLNQAYVTNRKHKYVSPYEGCYKSCNLQCNIQNLTKDHIRHRKNSIVQQLCIEHNVKTRNFVVTCVYMNFIVGFVCMCHTLFELDISTSVIWQTGPWRSFRVLDSYSLYS